MPAEMKPRSGEPPRIRRRRAASMVVPLLLCGCAGVGLVASTCRPAAASEAAGRTWAVSAHWENDAVAGDDRHYTNGTALSLSHVGQSWVDPLFDRL
ncbi:MAG: lipid A-modifier LpxR family protein, partial [Candidatus Methylomirabilota bacterium]